MVLARIRLGATIERSRSAHTRSSPDLSDRWRTIATTPPPPPPPPPRGGGAHTRGAPPPPHPPPPPPTHPPPPLPLRSRAMPRHRLSRARARAGCSSAAR